MLYLIHATSTGERERERKKWSNEIAFNIPSIRTFITFDVCVFVISRALVSPRSALHIIRDVLAHVGSPIAHHQQKQQ